MANNKRSKADGPTNYYGVVEEVTDADPLNNKTRSFILLDCVRADRFDLAGPGALQDRSALALVRAMSTPKRWQEQFSLGELAAGDWVSFRLDDSGSVPRAWELNAANNYTSGPSRSIHSMRRISGPPAALEPGDDQLVANLMFASASLVKRQRRASAAAAARRLGRGGKIEIVVLDVGQASAALIKRDGKPIGFFDAGAPIWFNKGSLPHTFLPPVLTSGFVILSHWDFDHFDLGRRHAPYHSLDWYGPEQPVGPNTARFQADLGNRLTFIHGTAKYGRFTLDRGTATLLTDRNGSGYQLRYEPDGQAVLLTGDASYDLIQAHMLTGISCVSVPHHAGRSAAPPPSPAAPARAIASYGTPNTYRHPHPGTLSDHNSRGWYVAPTAGTPTRLRGDRILYP